MSTQKSRELRNICDSNNHSEERNYQRIKSFFVLGVLCLSLPILGGCAAAGIAAAINAANNRPTAAASSAASSAGAFIDNQTVAIPTGSTLTYQGSDIYLLSSFTDEGVVTALGAPSSRPVTVSITTALTGSVSGLSYVTPDGTTSFPQNQINIDGPVIFGQSNTVVFTSIQQDYSSFGIWADGVSDNSAAIGAAFAGTPPAQMPATGTASFTGGIVGFYVSSTGVASGTAGAISSNVDFANRSGTVAVSSLSLTTGGSSAGLAFSGGFSVSGSSFSGVVTDGRGNTGSLQGAFFGPSAKEMAGTFSIRAGGLDSHIGAFGMSKP
jgi:hypothetical protein